MVSRGHGAAFDRLAERIRRAWLDTHPTEATRTAPGGKLDARLADFSAPAIRAEESAMAGFLAELRELDPNELDPTRRLDWRVVEGYLASELVLRAAQPPTRYLPQSYLDEIVLGLHWLFVAELPDRDQVLRSLLHRLQAGPEVLRAARQNLEVPPTVFTETAAMAARGVIEFVHGDLRTAWRGTKDAKLRGQLDAAADLLESSLREFAEFLEGQVILESNGELGLGRDAFEQLLWKRHGIDLSVDELVRVGQRVYHESLRALKLAAEQCRSGAVWTELWEEIDAESAESPDPLTDLRRAVAEARKFVQARGLIDLPEREELDYRATQSFLRPIVPRVQYTPPPPDDPRQRGVLWVTAASEGAGPRLPRLNRYYLDLVAVHEIVPGHHVHFVRDNLTGRKLRPLFWNQVGAEGWAYYGENLMLEEGYGDARGRLHQSRMNLVRACRVLIDVGLQTGTMSVSEATTFLARKARLSRAHAAAEVRRYAQTPTQPMSYVLGRLFVQELRDDFEAAGLGDRRDFHRAFLAEGTVPIPFARERLAIPGKSGQRVRLLARPEPRTRKRTQLRDASAPPPSSS